MVIGFHSMLIINEEYLRGRTRRELQKLAREHKIKANLKSKVIIDLLLQIVAQSQVDNKPAPEVQQAGPLPRNDDEPRVDGGDSPVTRIEKEPRAARSDNELLESSPESYVAYRPRRSFTFPDLAQMARDCGLTYPGSPCDIDNFDREQLDAPESLVQETVEMLAEFDREDQRLMERVITMREAISKLKVRVQNTRDLLRAEAARRSRTEKFFLYWQPIPSHWSYEEVWSGPIKVRDAEDKIGFTSSDEDEDVLVMSQQASNVHDSSERLAHDGTIDIGENVVQDEEDLLSPLAVPVTLPEPFRGIIGQKRPREETHTPSDDGRHAPRRRMDRAWPESPRALLSTPISKSVDKGKAKMTAEEVEALENAREAEQHLEEISAGDHHLATSRRMIAVNTDPSPSPARPTAS